MATSPDVTSMALFCDFENVALGVRDVQHDKFDIKLVLERLLLKGSIVVKKAYCDWERYKGFKSTMHEANFELIEIPHVRQSGKNSADIRLVVDALDLCYTKSHVNTFVIISGDSDFSPLVSKLRENNKQVIGVGVKQSTSDLLTANCDEFIFYDDLVRESGRQSTRREARPPPAASRKPAAPGGNPEESRRREEAEARRTKGVEMALQTFEALYAERSDGDKVWASVLKEAIKRRKPDFSESYYGFRSFGGLLEEMQARGFLKMGRDEKSNAYVFRSGGADAGAPAGEPASSAPEVLPVTHRVGDAEAREPRGRGRARGGRGRNAPERHDFEPAVAVEPPQQHALPYADEEEDDDAAERFADAARASQAGRTVNPPSEPAPDADTYVTDEAVTDADIAPPREAGSRRGNRGGRGGRGNAARKNAAPAPAAEPVAEVPAPAPAPVEAVAPVAAAKTPRARKTAAAKTPAAEKKPAARKAAARPARKTKPADEA
ncbi:NYN domain-containing protein [Scleromatobacter humisilvae]|uniref:NYN domain-containing protein n=1 Tax=Scleromatobacter humisilvae TaxID=2897159 RepID=A0A9X1YI12_9BURK|nr:NYN domain-containing protein [Scleromatobacter humisilvae]MCK9685108.1 NYN domain-containing protein [Scleromatobacter humisilvae]